jgi:hypothetical protein
MSNFLKHVGKHGDRKVVILFKEVPNEDHMCLVIYPDVLPAPWEDAIMRALTSDMGQQANEFADALHRTLLPDGRVVLETLHMEKMIKKIRTADVIVTPRSDSKIRLDELNKMLREMKTGEEAVKRMAENDAARGMVAPDVKRAAEQAYKDGRQQPVSRAQASQDGALDDRAIAGNMLAQATRMEAEAKGLIAEAARMKKEAERMDPTVTASKIPTEQPAKRGRPSKATKAVADAAQ